MIYWDKLKAFYYVTKFGSFTKASQHLNLTQPAITRAIQSLEAGLKAQLFHRSRSALRLTEEGEILFATTCEMIKQAATAEALINDKQKEPQGLLRLGTTSSIAYIWLMDFMPDFLKEYPLIKLQVIARDTAPDFFDNEADAAIRDYLPGRSDLVQEQMIDWKLQLYASQEYLDKFGTPQTLQDLDNHRLLVYGDVRERPFREVDWLLTLGKKSGEQRQPYLQINSAIALYKAAITGLGIISLSNHTPAEYKDKLVPVLPDLKAPGTTSYFVYPKHLEDSRRIQALRSYLMENIKKYFKG